MMKQLRSRKTMRRILQFTLILVIPSFVVFYGWGSRSGGRSSGETSVFGSIKLPDNLRRTELTTQDWVQAKNQLVSNLAEEMSTQYNQIKASQVEQALPRREIADQAVNVYALRTLAQEQDLQVSQRELSAMISQSFPGMDVGQIRSYIENRMGTSFRQWVNDMRRGQEMVKAQQYVMAATEAPLPVLWNNYLRQKTKFVVPYAEIPVMSRAAALTVTPEELQQEYDARKPQLEEPDKAVYQFVAIRRFELQRDVRLTTDQILLQYEKDKGTKYTTPAQATIRHVLIQVPPGAAAEQADQAKAQIDKVYADAAKGVPLSELANQYSQDPDNTRPLDDKSTETIKMGGLAPYPITREQESRWGKPFIDAVFTLPEDKISTPILTNMGWDIFQLVARSEPWVQPFSEVRRAVEIDTRDEIVTKRFEDKRKELEEARKNQTTLEGIAAALHVDVRETSPAVVGADYILGVGTVSDYLGDILDLQPGGEPTGVIDTRGAYAIIRMKQFIPKHIPSLEDVKTKLTDLIQARKAYTAALEEARKVSDRVTRGDNLTSVALELSLPHGQGSQPFELGSPPPPFNQVQDFAAWVLETPVGKPFIAQGPKRGEVPSTLYVCEVTEKTLPDRKAFLGEVNTLAARQLSTGRITLLRGYLDDARQRLQPRYNPEVVTE